MLHSKLRAQDFDLSTIVVQQNATSHTFRFNEFKKEF